MSIAWKVDAYETAGGEKPARKFLEGLQGRNKVEAIALLKLLTEQGNQLRRPHSAALGEGLFELRGKEVRLFYAFLPGRVAVVLDGEVKKRSDIPIKTLARVRRFKLDLTQRGRAAKAETRSR